MKVQNQIICKLQDCNLNKIFYKGKPKIDNITRDKHILTQNENIRIDQIYIDSIYSDFNNF